MTVSHTEILVASDGSDEARLTIDQAIHLAALQHAELHLVHVGLLSAWVQPDSFSAAPRDHRPVRALHRDGRSRARVSTVAPSFFFPTNRFDSHG